MFALPALAKLAVPRWAIELAGVLLLLLAAWGALHFYGQRQYSRGEAASDAKWQAASQKLKDDAAKSRNVADEKAAQQSTAFIQQHTKDQEAVNAAEQKGTSPLDALFGN